MKAERIYIAGPYYPRGADGHDIMRQAQHNTDAAIEASNIIIEKGHYIFVPHLSHYIHVHHSCKRDYKYWWYKEDITFLEHWATAIYMLPTWKKSPGAELELERAKELGLKVYYSLDEIPKRRKVYKTEIDEEVKEIIEEDKEKGH